MHTGENEQGLRKILDLTRLISIVLLGIHFYYYCYVAFQTWQLTAPITDRILANIQNTGLFDNFHKSKLIALGFLSISLLGAKGRKDKKLNYNTASSYIITGLLIFFLSYPLLLIKLKLETSAIIYISVTIIGFVLILTGGTLLSRVIQFKLKNKDIFNKENESFPQEERLIKNEYSINLPALYNIKQRIRKSWINIINPFRGILVLGSPGSGKSYFVIRHVITQHMSKGFTMFVYDFKYDDLSLIAYNTYLKHKTSYPTTPQFYIINFDDLSRSHRCNPLGHASMVDITDAAESARTILLGLNREWIKRQGNFLSNHPLTF
jgi:hypothetical protein